MMPSSDMKHELCEILWRIGDGSSTPDDVDRLESLIGNDPTLQTFAARFAAMYGMLHWDRGLATPCDRRQDAAAMPASRIPPTNPREEVLPGMAVQAASGWFASGWPVAYLVATVIFAIGLAAGALVRVSAPTGVDIVRSSGTVPPLALVDSSVVARVTGMVDCEWEGSDAANQKSEVINPKSLLRLGDRIGLKSGLMEVSYCSGARVVLQGPVTYEVESAFGGYLFIGKLSACLDGRPGIPNQKSEIRNQKFFVRTPTALVTDLGTEFGVEVDKDGTTQSHVFHGRVLVQAVAADGQAKGEGRLLRENESAMVDGRDGKRAVSSVPLDRPSRFVRQLPKQKTKSFDLVDVVAGGDGFSGRRNAGINPVTAQPCTTFVRMGQTSQDIPSGDRTYHRFGGSPYVDGVFVPDGSQGEVQTDSAGHRCTEFLPTSNQWCNAIWAGGTIPGDATFSPIRPVLNGVDYGTDNHGCILIESNKAITFDLDAIRRANGEYVPTMFRAVAGTTGMDATTNASTCADVWVVVDGKVRFRRREINAFNGAFSIKVPIHTNDRYLTLASTDGGDGIGWDWIMFGDPRIELSLVPATPARHRAGD